MKLLEKNRIKKFSDPDEKEFFIEQFHKISYHIAETAENKRQEQFQKELQKFVK